MLCKHGNTAPCVECDIGPLNVENEALRAMMAKLVEALEEMIDVAKRVDSWESFPYYPMERAEEALALYRKQGGDL